LQFELWTGDAAAINAKRVRKQKTDRQDAQLILRLMLKDDFPQIWVPSWENRDLRQLLWHRHRMVQARTRIMNQLQAVALNEGLRCKKRLWRDAGREQLEKFALTLRRTETQRAAAFEIRVSPVPTITSTVPFTVPFSTQLRMAFNRACDTSWPLVARSVPVVERRGWFRTMPGRRSQTSMARSSVGPRLSLKSFRAATISASYPAGFRLSAKRACCLSDPVLSR
jgi:hypothetical protein